MSVAQVQGNALIHGHRLTAAVTHFLFISWDRKHAGDKREVSITNTEKKKKRTSVYLLIYMCLFLCVTGVQTTVDLPVREFFVFLQ